MNNIHDQLKNLGAKLIGSRMMGFNNPDSDWDYLITWTPNIEYELNKMGFDDTSENYTDNVEDSIITFMRRYIVIDSKIQVIEVQVVFCNELATIIMNTFVELKNNQWLKYMEKPYRKLSYLIMLHKNINYLYLNTDKRRILAHFENVILSSQPFLFNQLKDIYTNDVFNPILY